MKLASAGIALLMAAGASAKDDGLPHPPAPQWVASDDPALNRLFTKTVGDHLGRVQWSKMLFSRAEGAPLETDRNGADAISIGRKITPRVMQACVASYFLVPDDPKHWFPEDARHWEKFRKTYPCLVVEPPPHAGGVVGIPDLVRRVYGGPIFLTGKISAAEVATLVDLFWEELIKQCSAPEKYRIPDCRYPVWLNDDGAPMWATLDGVILTRKGSRRVATLHLQIGKFDDTEGCTFMFLKTTRGWEPTDETNEMMATFRESD